MTYLSLKQENYAIKGIDKIILYCCYKDEYDNN
jgi:hypothetical protein